MARIPKLGAKGLEVLAAAIEVLDPTHRYVELDVKKQTVRYASDFILHEAISTYVGEEEPTRAYLVAWLCTEGGYLPPNIELEKRYSVGRPKLGAENDILVKHPDGTTYALIEVKAPEEYDVDADKFIKGQLFDIAPLEPGCSVLAYVTVNVGGTNVSIRTKTIVYSPGDTLDTWKREARPASNELPANYGEPIHIHLEKGSSRDLREDATRAELDRLRKRLHDILWRGSKPDNLVYEYVVKLLLAKIFDEKTCAVGERYRFQIRYRGNQRESPRETFDRVNSLFEEAYERYLNLDGGTPAEKLNDREFSAEQIAFVVELLQDIAFTAPHPGMGDLLGGFFEGITREGFKQTKGLFFTHINIVAFILYALEIDELALDKIRSNAVYSERLPYIVDPSCGSGTFLLAAMKIITDRVVRERKKVARNDDVRDFLREKFPEEHPNLWARDFLFGIDDSELLAMATKVNMVLHRDGNTHIYHSDGLSPLAMYMDQRLKGRSRSDLAIYSREVAESFDLVVSNPPFSITHDPQTARSLESTFELASVRNSENLFLERWYQLLRPNGRLGVVLPESFFSTQENLWARLFLFDHFDVKAVVSLPRHAFEPWTPTRTSLLFARKKTPHDEEVWKSTRVGHEADILDLRKRATRRLNRALKTPLSDEHRDEICNALASLGINMTRKELKAADDDRVTELIAAVASVDPVTKAFAKTVEAVGYSFLVFTVSQIGYKRTKRAEYQRPNDLFSAHSLTLDPTRPPGRSVPNLNASPPDWSIEVKTGPEVLVHLRTEGLWK